MSLEHFRDPLREFVPAQFRPINFFAERRDGLACREPTGSIRPFAAHDRATPVVELLQSFPLWLRGFGLRRVHHLLRGFPISYPKQIEVFVAFRQGCRSCRIP